jgi:DNA/RNA-binding domain of Phe-tRNA-synthetase-like protein
VELEADAQNAHQRGTDIWFVLERLEPMPIEALLQAGESIAEGVRNLAPHAQISQRLIRKSD